MKSVTTALQNLLNTGVFLQADLFTITLTGGTVLRYTSYDAPLTWGGSTWLATGAALSRTQLSWKNDLSTDTMDLDIIIPASGTVLGVPFFEAVVNGVFDGAVVQLDRAYMAPSASTTVVGVLAALFLGRMGEFSGGRSLMQVPVNSHLELLDADFPRNLYQSACVHTLYDGPDAHGNGCKATVISATGTVVGVSTVSTIPVSIAAAPGYYAAGVIRFLSGLNAGLERTIQAFTGSVAVIFEPLPQLPVAGDSILLIAGCDKTMAMCAAKFNNLANFLGMPFIPVAETAT